MVDGQFDILDNINKAFFHGDTIDSVSINLKVAHDSVEMGSYRRYL